MSKLTEEEQGIIRNAILCLAGQFRKLKKAGKITDQEHILLLADLKKIEGVLDESKRETNRNPK